MKLAAVGLTVHLLFGAGSSLALAAPVAELLPLVMIPVHEKNKVFVAASPLRLRRTEKAAQRAPVKESESDTHRWPWQLILQGGLPELLGLQLEYRGIAWASGYVQYAMATPVRIDASVKSKVLAKRDRLYIKSPGLEIPFDMDFGPHYGLGINLYPFEGSFFIGLAYERRDITIRGHTESPLLFVDESGETLSNTIGVARIESKTHQDLSRIVLGHSWSFWNKRLSLGFYLGITQALRSRTRIKPQIQLKNAQATRPEEANVQGLAEALAEQEKILHENATRALRGYENKSLPLVGVTAGLRF